MRTLFIGVGELAHMRGSGGLEPLAGAATTDRPALVSGPGEAILVEEDVILEVAAEVELVAEHAPWLKAERAARPAKVGGQGGLAVWDLSGRAVVPGLVDAHSHLLWAGDRSREVALRQQGWDYQRIAASGGGIAHTVAATRTASDASLLAAGRDRLATSLRHGTTMLEAKSGYGLDTEHELRLLRLADELGREATGPALAHTWLGAHATPPAQTGDTRSEEVRQAEYVEALIGEQLPAVLKQGIARAVDVFCEPSWFDTDQTERIVRAAQRHHLAARLHVDEFADGGGLALAASLVAETADHAGHSDEDARASAHASGTLQGFLPGTPHVLGHPRGPPMQLCLDEGWAWSLASDFNPNCHSLSLPFVGSLAVQREGIDPLAALVAVTRNPAARLPHPSGRRHGIIAPGAVASFNVLWGEHVDGWALTPGQSSFTHTVNQGRVVSHLAA